MSHQTVADITNKAMDDLAFARRLQADPESILSEYDDLTDEEVDVLKAGDQNVLDRMMGPQANLVNIAGIVFPSSGAEE